MKIKIELLRIVFIVYFLFLFLLLTTSNYVLRDLNNYYFLYFIELYLLLEFVNFVLKKLKLAAEIKHAYLILLFYTILNSLTLAFYPEWRNVIFNRFGHFVSGAIFALIAHQIIIAGVNKTNSKLSNTLLVLFIFALASTAGVFNEIIELILDYTTGSHRLGPTPDTAVDLLMNTFGIITVLVVKKGAYDKK